MKCVAMSMLYRFGFSTLSNKPIRLDYMYLLSDGIFQIIWVFIHWHKRVRSIHSTEKDESAENNIV